MKDIIVGTAGHIDHGKTSLVKALTGVDTDRWAEEKRRGITIDLGFAHLQLTPEIRLGFVDVPGHERFVRNMLAGVSGIDFVLFVIAADESIKPQTREHFDICRLLGIRAGVIVLTKCDAASEDILELVKLEVEEFVAGSFLQDAPIVAVSAVTGEGLPLLREVMRGVASDVSLRNESAPARLPIDRAFAMRGWGTVITGTLVAGSIAREQELELLPSRKILRVRGLQTYGYTVESAVAGTRTAVNLAGIDAHEIHRGMVLAERGCFEPTQQVDCSVELLRSARGLKSRTPVHFHAGADECQATVRLLQASALSPGSSAFARLTFSKPTVLAPGDRFILRQFSPVVTIAGGTVWDAQPPSRKNASALVERLRVLSGDDLVSKLKLLVDESEIGLSATELARRLGLGVSEAVRHAQQGGMSVLQAHGWVLGRTWLQARRADLLRELRDYHRASPLSPGMPKHELKGRVLPKAPPFVFDAALAGLTEIAIEGDRVRHRTHRVVLAQDEERARGAIISAFQQAGFAAPSVLEVLSSSKIDAARGQALLQLLLRERVLIRVNDDLVLHESAVTELKSLLHQMKHQRFTVSTFKEWTGISRKYAVPLLEFLDRERVTQRQGDWRTVL